MIAFPSARSPRVRRRWPSAAFLLGLIATALILWRVATARSPATLPPAGVPIPVIRAIDGDTLLLEGGFRVRLYGVNTPETKHPTRPAEPFGSEAYEFTRALVDQRTVTLEFDRERLDHYRRILAYVFLDDGSLLNQRLIETGHSPAVVRFPIRSDRRRVFLDAERHAQNSKSGIWALPAWQARLAAEQERQAATRR